MSNDNIQQFPESNQTDINMAVKTLQATEAAANAQFIQAKTKLVNFLIGWVSITSLFWLGFTLWGFLK